MMKHFMVAVLFCLFSAGFAAAAPPSFEQLAKLPVVRFGEPTPDKDYILLFPAGQPITIYVSIEGSLFTRPAKADLTLTPAREILVFREWASLDGVHWVPRSELIKSDVSVKIPGYNHPQDGSLKVRMDLAGAR